MSQTKAQLLSPNGNFGIGTDTPNGDLEVFNSNQAISIVRGVKATLAILGDSDNNGASETDSRIILCSDGTIANYADKLTTSPLDGHGFEISLINDEPGSGLRFHDGSANLERFRIDSSGRLLIGETSAVLNTTNALLQIGAEQGANMVLYRDASSVSTDDSLGLIRFYSNAGSSKQEHARITATAGAASGANDKPGNLLFYTTADGASSPTEKLRIKSDGDVFIGNISHSNDNGADSNYRTITLADTTNGAQLHLRGQSPKLFMDVTGGGTAEIYYDSGDFTISSGEPGNAGSSEKLRITSEGKLFIDRTHASATTGNHPALDIDTYANGTAGATFATGIDFRIAGVHKKRLAITNADANVGTGDWIFYRDNGANEALRITSGGDLFVAGSGGSGDTTQLPNGSTININGTDSNDGFSIIRYNAGYGAYGLNIGRSKSGTVGTNAAVTDGNDIGHITFYGADGSSYLKASMITAQVDGDPAGSGMPGRLLFKTSPDGNATPTERLRIDSDGAVIVGDGTNWTKYVSDANFQITDNTNAKLVLSNPGNSTYSIAVGTDNNLSFRNEAQSRTDMVIDYTTGRMRSDTAIYGKFQVCQIRKGSDVSTGNSVPTTSMAEINSSYRTGMTLYTKNPFIRVTWICNGELDGAMPRTGMRFYYRVNNTGSWNTLGQGHFFGSPEDQNIEQACASTIVHMHQITLNAGNIVQVSPFWSVQSTTTANINFGQNFGFLGGNMASYLILEEIVSDDGGI